MITTKRVAVSAVCAAAGALLFSLGAGAPAMAATTEGAPHATTTVVSTTTSTNDACVAAVTAAIEAGNDAVSTDVCTMTATVSESPAKGVTTADLDQAQQSLSPASFTQLKAAAAAGTVKKKNYSQSFNNITDKQSQSGVFYYDGSRAWVTAKYRGYQGTHNCSVSWSVGYVVEQKACSESGSSSQRDLYVRWHFSAIPSGGFVNWDESHTMHVNSAGRIWQ